MLLNNKKCHGISTLALVAGLGFSGTIQAFNVYEDGETYFDLYGRIHLTLNNDDGNDYISEEGSRLGFKAGHRINPKLEGFIRAEFRFTANDRDEARPNVIDDIRNTYVGLRFEDVGAVKVGNFDSIYYQNIPKVINVRNTVDWRALAKGGDRARGNSISFESQSFDGFSLGVAGKLDPEDEDAGEEETLNLMGYVAYETGPVRFAAGYDEAEGDDDALLGASVTYKISPQLSVGALFEEQGDIRHYGIAPVFSYSEGKIYGNVSYMENSDMNLSDVQYVAGGSYRLSDPMFVYLEYASSTDREINAIDKDWWALGVRYDF